LRTSALQGSKNRYFPGARTFAVAGLAVAVMLLLRRPSLASAATTTGAMAQVQALVGQAIKIMQDKDTPVAQRRRELRSLVDEHFDFDDMARSALGYHWRKLQAAQRQEFSKLFKSFIEDAYLAKIEDYSGQKVKFIGANMEGQGYSRVRSRIVQDGKAPIPLNYMLERENNAWKIYDVTVDNISIIANYRNQFNRVINNQGFDTLMADMRNKQQQLAASLGER
jgi:phospholipid transport system substrate-binding protein